MLLDFSHVLAHDFDLLNVDLFLLLCPDFLLVRLLTVTLLVLPCRVFLLTELKIIIRSIILAAVRLV